MALNSITKREILDQLEKIHKIQIPKNLIENEIKAYSATDNSNSEKNNVQAAEKRIKLGLILNECGELNNIKVNEDEIKQEIQKQVKSMPGQEKLVFDYYQKNPSATQQLQSNLYEDKIINFIKLKTNLVKKEITIKDAEKLIKVYNEKNKVKTTQQVQKKDTISKKNKKKISKK